MSTLYDISSGLARQLQTVALLISGGLKTKVYVVRIGGFDTHANQVVQGNVTQGQHADLLAELSGAIHAFQDDLQKQGLEEKVLGMTFSEFGRQIRSNDSLGTDHGTAAPLFLFGSCVQGGVVGNNPEIPADVEPQAGVPMGIDYRQVYGTVLRDWLGVSESEVSDLLFDEFTALPLIDACGTTTSNDAPGFEFKPYGVDVSPNPLTGPGNISFDAPGGRVVVRLHDQTGRLTRVIADREFGKGPQVISFNAQDLPSGFYVVSVMSNGTRETVKLIKS